MHLWKMLVIVLLYAMQSVVALAHDEAVAEEEKGPWSGEFGLGYLASDGNTDSSSLAGRVLLGYATENWQHAVEFKGYGATDDTGTTAENYQAWLKSIYNLNERNYLFGKLEWRKNEFSGYPKQKFETAGYGRRILQSDKLELNVEVGAGFSQSRKVVVESPRIVENEDEAIATLGGDFHWKISDTASFEQLLSINSSSENTAWETITRLKANVVGGVALAIGYTIQGNTDVAGDTEKTDRFTTVTLEYSF